MKDKDRKKSNGLDFEIKFYEQILKERPNFVQALIALADAYTKRGYYRKGLKIDRKLAKLRPGDPTVFYNLSCSYSLLKMNKLAFNALRKAIELGFTDFKYIQQDPDLENLRGDEYYREFISRYIGSKIFQK
jgi:tetratricopeptide (TPR) repeat protein